MLNQAINGNHLSALKQSHSNPIVLKTGVCVLTISFTNLEGRCNGTPLKGPGIKGSVFYYHANFLEE